MPTVSLECFQNEYLAQDAIEVDAVITVTASGAAPGTAAPAAQPAAEIIIVDVSGSMEGRKLSQAMEATAAAVDAVRDGVHFAVIAGNHEAFVVYPPARPLAVASPVTRSEARQALRSVRAGGGTAIGRWITLASEAFAGYTGVRHAILLTDGKDEHETAAELEQALAAASGAFQCDCRGVGTDWIVSELRRVADALLGTVDIVADPDGLAADFTAAMEAAMGRMVAQVALRVWTPRGAEVAFVKQVAPEVADLTGSAVAGSPSAADYPTGAWGNESRDYHLSVHVPAGAVGDEMLAARVTLLLDGEPAGQALVRAVWTDDTALSTRINKQVAHYTGQAELAEAIQEGLAARRSGDIETATTRLGKAVQLAEASGNSATTRLLAKVVEVDDAATGRVRLKTQVAAADEMTLDTRSTKTVRVRK